MWSGKVVGQGGSGWGVVGVWGGELGEGLVGSTSTLARGSDVAGAGAQPGPSTCGGCCCCCRRQLLGFPAAVTGTWCRNPHRRAQARGEK